MALKCCVRNCESNYNPKTGNKTATVPKKKYVPVYKLPSEELQPGERAKWVSVIPRESNHLEFSKYAAVCKNHWPEDAPFVLFRGKLRPSVPPSIFTNIPPTCCFCFLAGFFYIAGGPLIIYLVL